MSYLLLVIEEGLLFYFYFILDFFLEKTKMIPEFKGKLKFFELLSSHKEIRNNNYFLFYIEKV